MLPTLPTKRIAALAALLTAWLTVAAQPLCRVSFYDEEDGLPHGHATQLVQDQQGLIWIATWNGLARFDGYDFQTFKTVAGDGCHMSTDRIRDCVLRPDGNIVCRVGEDDYYLFSTRTCRFSDLTGKAERQQAMDDLKRYRNSTSLLKGGSTTWTGYNGVQWTLHGSGRLTYRNGEGHDVDYALDTPIEKPSFATLDQQGNLWVLGADGIYKLCTDVERTQRLDIAPQGEVKCLFTDRKGRLWLSTKNDEALRIYQSGSRHPLGYLGADGRLHQDYIAFGAAVYCMYQQADGTLWLGTKPNGLYRMQEQADGTFRISHFTQLPSTNVYNIIDDSHGRLWVATLGGGLCYTSKPLADVPVFRTPRQYPKESAQRVRFLHLTRQGRVLMATTTDGLLVTRIEADADQMQFRLHHREADRTQSLSSSATMDIAEDSHGNLYISTESGGVSRITDDDITASQLHFSHYTAGNHLLGSDVALSLTTLPADRMLVVSNHLLTTIDSTGRQHTIDAHCFNHDYRFSDAHPQQLPDHHWLFALKDGAFIIDTKQIHQDPYQPPLVLTGVNIQGSRDQWDVTQADTITLLPGERSLTIHFAALDYRASERLSYAFRLQPNGQWNSIGHDRSATLLDLEPGTYVLEIRSTNADGSWADNVRRLTIVVKPTFWQSTIGRLLMVLLAALVAALVVYTLLYIRRMKRKQHETLEAYLALIEQHNTHQRYTSTLGTDKSLPADGQRDDPVLQRVVDFIEQNIANSDAGVGDMAAAAAVSRSGLQRKLKQAMGITPQDLMREARIKRACQLLRQTSKTVAEVAYACGFTDPKYFSRCFKQSTGSSPSEYKNSNH